MKLFSIILLIIIPLLLFGQNQNHKRKILFNKGVVTYVDNSDLTFYTISFKADTMMATEMENMFMVDSSPFQFIKFPLSEKLYKQKFDSKSEKLLLTSYKDYEFNYQKREVLKQKITEKTEFFQLFGETIFIMVL